MVDPHLQEGLNEAFAGSAVCFFGAGFAAQAYDAGAERHVPTTSELTQELWTLVGTEPEEGSTLADLAEYCQDHGDLSGRLQTLLVKRLTLTRPSKSQNTIVNCNWRAIFTTNFDDIVEQSRPKDTLQIVTPLGIGHSINTKKTPLYYLHGRAKDITESDKPANIVISESNYLNIKKNNIDLYSVLSNEIHTAKHVFFIGYSLRDMEIAKRVFSITDSIQSKSSVICAPEEGPVAQARLAKFGKVFPLGIDGFSDLLEKQPEPKESQQGLDRLAFVRPLLPSKPSADIQKEQVDSLILTGEFDASAYAAQKQSNEQDSLYCVERTTHLEMVFGSISTSLNRFIVTADIGNGKTTFLHQIAYGAIERGFTTYWIGTNLNEVFKDIDKITSSTSRYLFIIDDLVRSKHIAKYIGARLNSLGVIVCSTRENIDDTQHAETSELLGGATKEIELNHLLEHEIKQWDALFERWGYWENRIYESPLERFSFLSNDCGAENRSIVVSVFRTSLIAKKISDIVAYFLSSSPQFTRAFVAVLIASLCQKHVQWDRLVEWLHIDSQSLKNTMRNHVVFDFMSGQREWYKFTSTQLSDYIFKHFEFDRELVVDVYTRIVRETAYAANDPRSGFDSRENLKELMKFRFLVNLFGENASSLTSIEAVYRRLSKVPRIRENDQFWLQYAMSSIEQGNIFDAEIYINTALGIAAKRGEDYSPHQIIDQRIRLLFLKNCKSGKKPNEEELRLAISDLTNSLRRSGGEVIYPIRSAPFILDLLDEKIEELPSDICKLFLEVLDEMKQLIGEANLPKTKKGETKSLRETVRRARLVIQNS